MQLKRIISIICILVFITGCGNAADREPELLEPVSAQKEYGMVRQGDLAQKVYYNAYVYPELHYISSEVDGLIKEVPGAIGDHVAEGETLIVLDTEEIDRQIISYSQQLEELDALFALDQQIGDKEIRLAQISSYIANQENAALQEKIDSLNKKIKKQRKDKSVSENRIEKNKDKVKDYKEQQAYLNEEINDYTHEAASGYLSQSLNNELYAIDKKECEEKLKELKEKKVHNKIVSPCDGIITCNNLIATTYTGGLDYDKRNLEAQMPFMIIADENSKYLSIPGLKEKKFDAATMSAFAVINGKEYPLTKYAYDDRIEKLNQKLQQQYYNTHEDLDIRFSCPNAILDSLSVGDFVSIYFVEKQKKNVLCAPNDTIYHSPEETYVIKLVDGKEEKTVVETGMHTSHETEILSGVNQGDILLSKSVFFEANGIHEMPLTKTDYLWEEEMKSFFLAPLYIKYVFSKAPEARLQEIYVDDGDEVKKGDVLAKLTLYSNQSSITECSYKLQTLEQDRDDALAQLQKQQNQVTGALYELPDQNNSAADLLKEQIAYFELLKQQINARYTYESRRVEQELSELKEDNEHAVIKAECDGIVKNIQKQSIGKMVYADTLLMQIIPKEKYTVGIMERKALVYGMPITLYEKDAANSDPITTTLCRAPNVCFPWDSAYFDYASMNYYEYLLALPGDNPLSSFSDLDRAVVRTRNYPDSYQITKKMLFEDDYGSFVYLMQDGKRIKQYVNLTEFHNGVAVILDGISADCTVLEREKE